MIPLLSDHDEAEAEVIATTDGQVLKSRYTSRDVSLEEALVAANAVAVKHCTGRVRIILIDPDTKEVTKTW